MLSKLKFTALLGLVVLALIALGCEVKKEQTPENEGKPAPEAQSSEATPEEGTPTATGEGAGQQGAGAAHAHGDPPHGDHAHGNHAHPHGEHGHAHGDHAHGAPVAAAGCGGDCAGKKEGGGCGGGCAGTGSCGGGEVAADGCAGGCGSKGAAAWGTAEHFGGNFTLIEPPTQLAAVMKDVDNFVGETIKVEGTVKSVCKKKGCWMQLEPHTTDALPVRVTFKDYGFFVPKDMDGALAVMEGQMLKDTMPQGMRRHYAEDAGKSKAEIEAIVGDIEVVKFVATAVDLKRPGKAAIEAKSIEAKPADAKPTDAKPAGTKAAPAPTTAN